MFYCKIFRCYIFKPAIFYYQVQYRNIINCINMIADTFCDCFFCTHGFPSTSGPALYTDFIFIKCNGNYTIVAFFVIGENKLLFKCSIITSHAAIHIYLFTKNVFKTMQQFFCIGVQVTAGNKEAGMRKFLQCFFSNGLCSLPVIFIRKFFKQNAEICPVYIEQKYSNFSCSYAFFCKLPIGSGAVNGNACIV